MKSLKALILPLVLISSLPARGAEAPKPDLILNASFDSTRELFEDLNGHFLAQRQLTQKTPAIIQQSHASSDKQVQAVIDGLEADVVTLASAQDIDQIAEHQLLSADWQTKFPHKASPYNSTIVFLVRAGNPKNILDWSDLVRDGLEVLTPNPKTSGAARWTYLAAWAFASNKFAADDAKTLDFIRDLYARVISLDGSARESTRKFVEKGVGDVLITWESEAHQAIKKYQELGFEIVTPSLSILAEPAVAIVDSVVGAKGTRKIAEDYLNYLYSEQAQTLIAEHYFRPTNEKLAAAYQGFFKNIPLVTVEREFGGWANIQRKHFDDGALFDQIIKANEIRR